MAREFDGKPEGTTADCFDWSNAMFHHYMMGQPWRWQRMAPNPAGCWRFLVAALDGVPLETQLAFWWSAPLPVAALVHNGGNGVQAWVRLDAATAAEVEPIGLRLRAMGCSTAPLHGAARMARCPGAERLDTGAIQRLLFVDPMPPADGSGRRGVRP